MTENNLETETNDFPQWKWNLVKFLVPAISFPLLTIVFEGAIEKDMAKRAPAIYKTSSIYEEDINKDGLKDIVYHDSNGTQIWYNQGNNIYKRGGSDRK